MKNVQIKIKKNNRQVMILAPVKDSLHASMLSDRIDKLPYLKVSSRKFFEKAVYSQIFCFTIPGLFTIEKLHNDLDTMSDLINIPTNEEN